MRGSSRHIGQAVAEEAIVEIRRASRVVGARVGPGGPELNITWEDYDHTFNTWESRVNVLDKSLERAYAVDSHLQVDIEHALDETRELLYLSMAKLKSAEAGMEVVVPTAALGSVAHALLRRFARVPSQAPSSACSAINLALPCSLDPPQPLK